MATISNSYTLKDYVLSKNLSSSGLTINGPNDWYVNGWCASNFGAPLKTNTAIFQFTLNSVSYGAAIGFERITNTRTIFWVDIPNISTGVEYTILINYKNQTVKIMENGKYVNSIKRPGFTFNCGASGDSWSNKWCISLSHTGRVKFDSLKYAVNLPDDTIMEYIEDELYKKANAVYGMNSGVFTKLSDNWATLSDVEKITIFKSTNHEIASLADLSTLSNFKILNLNETEYKPIHSITAVPKDQLVLPKDLISTESFESIDKAILKTNIASDIVINMRFNENGVNDLVGNVWSNNGVKFNESGKFGDKAAYFDGVSTLSLPDNDRLNLGLSDFTISLFAKYTNGSNYKVLLADNISDYQGLFVSDGGKVVFNLSGANRILKSNTVKNDTECDHIAVTRKDGIFYLFINGVLEDKNEQYMSTKINLGNGGTTIGGFRSNGYNFVGHIDDICIVKDKALWTKDFTPPTNYLLQSKVPLCKLLVTNGLKTYQTYDFATQSWQIVDQTKMSDVAAKGIDSSQLQNVPRDAWKEIMSGKSGIGFAYMLSIEDTTDICEVDKLELQVDMKGSWKKALHGTDYDYEYPANNELSVTLMTNGDYKINYCKG